MNQPSRARLPAQEAHRLTILARYTALPTLPAEAFDRIARLAAAICQTPIALVAFIDHEHFQCKAHLGFEHHDLPRENPFCAYTIRQPARIMIVPDTLRDERFSRNDLVLAHPGIRFYAGVSLMPGDDAPIGAICVADTRPRELEPSQIDALLDLRDSFVSELRLAYAAAEAQSRSTILSDILQALNQAHSADDMLRQTVASMMRLDRWYSVGISVPSDDGERWQTRAENRMAPGETGQWHSVHAGVIGRAYRTGEIQHVQDTSTDPHFFLSEDEVTIGSELAVPLLFEHQVLGVINLESVTAHAFTDEDISFTAAIATALAISLKNIQRFASLRHEEERYRGLLASLDSAIAGIDADGRLLYVNETAARQFDVPAEELIGRTLFALLPETAAVAQLALIQRAIRADMPLRDELIREIAGAPRWQRISIQPIHDHTCKVAYALLNMTDIHDLKAAQQSLEQLNRTLEQRVLERTATLRESEAQNRLLFEESPEAMALIDRAGRIVRTNHAFELLTGVAGATLLGGTLNDAQLVPHDQLHLIQEAATQALQVDNPYVALEFSVGADPEQARTISMRLFALALEGRPHLLTSMRDITAAKRAEEALRRANMELERAMRMKDEFLANMSHELRTPLHGILALSESLLEQFRGPLNEYQQRSVRNIESSGRHLLELINDLLDIARIEAGNPELQIELVQVDEVCRASLLFVHQQALNKRIELAYHTPSTQLMLLVDPRRLKQMLVNLLSNAVKFTPAGGMVQLDVTLNASDPTIHFTVQDNGVGIAPADQAKLFQPFVQLDAGLSRKYEGTGLGLTLVRQLAQLHGGSVSLESSGIPGEGSRFTIILPYRTHAE